jgi:hypothetical protein
LSEGGPETKKISCNYCRVETNHSLRTRYTWFRKIEDGTAIDLADLKDNVDSICKHENSIWTCAGCDTVIFEWQLMYPSLDNEGKWEEHNGGFFSTALDRSILPKVFRMNPKLSRLYGEVLTSFKADCLLLCTIGLRALIEGVCEDKELKKRNLEDKIDGLIKFLPSLNLIEALHAFRFAGNDAAHDLEALTRDEARMAIEVMEDLLNFLYDLDYKASQMRNASKRLEIKSTKHGSVQ